MSNERTCYRNNSRLWRSVSLGTIQKAFLSCDGFSIFAYKIWSPLPEIGRICIANPSDDWQNLGPPSPTQHFLENLYACSAALFEQNVRFWGNNFKGKPGHLFRRVWKSACSLLPTNGKLSATLLKTNITQKWFLYGPETHFIISCLINLW